MEFEQPIKTNSNEKNYHIENLKITREFSKQLLKEMGELVRSIVLFGSNSNNTQDKDSDIDVMIVLNNVSVFVTDELKEAYRIITNSLNQKLANNKIHIMTVNLSDLWDMARKGDPVLINVLRYGTPIFDRDLMDPLQYLLEIGRIRPTKESIYNYKTRSETLLEETQKHLQNSMLDLYYSVVDITHAVLMSKQVAPESPKSMPKVFKQKFKNTNLEKYDKIIEEIYDLSKKVEKNQIQVTGKDIDKYTKIVTKLVSEFSKEIDSNLKNQDFEY